MSYPGAVVTQAQGINNDCQIVGNYNGTSGIIHGFLDSGGSFSAFNHPGATWTEALGIKDIRQNSRMVPGRQREGSGISL
jgi:hypothetical protein